MPLDLSLKGEEDARKLALNTKGATSIETTPQPRGLQTGRIIAEQTDAGIQPTVNPALAPWNLGTFQGKLQSDVNPQINDYIANKPDEAVPGGESFNDFRKRFIGGLQQAIDSWRPGEKPLLLTHSIGVHTAQAWFANGAPASGEISTPAMLQRQHMGPTAMWRIDPQAMTMTPVANASQDGVFIARHADTAWDNLPKSPTTSLPTNQVAPTSLPTNQGQTVPPAEASAHNFSTTHVSLPEKIALALIAFGKSIPNSQLSEEGREADPHVTIKYGLHGDDPEAVRRLLANQGPIVLTLGKTSIFPGVHTEGDGKADVLKISVESPDLEKLNGIIKQLPNTETHPVYQPHATVAYLKPGKGQNWDGKSVPGVTGQTVTISSITFSDKDGNETEIPLTGKPDRKSVV